jgi:hypothetical protein
MTQRNALIQGPDVFVTLIKHKETVSKIVEEAGVIWVRCRGQSKCFALQ